MKNEIILMTILSAFAMSLWLWIYVAAGLLVSYGRNVGMILSAVSLLIDINKHPMTALGAVCSILVVITLSGVLMVTEIIQALTK